LASIELEEGFFMGELISQEVVVRKIFVIRGRKVMMDKDLAELYGVETKVLLQAVKRNRERFPSDFMYLLTKDEVAILRSQIVTSRWGGLRYLPYAFTEQGIAMLSSVLRSKKAIEVNIAIMRAFVKLREFLASNKELAHQVKEHGKILNELMAPPEIKPKKKIGFHT